MTRKRDKINHMKEMNKSLNESYYSDKENIDELFGMSDAEKKAKQLRSEVKVAFDEISNYDLTNLISEPSKSKLFKDEMGIIANKLNSAKESMPTFYKLAPNMFDAEDVRGGLIYYTNERGKHVPMIFPSSWYTILSKGRSNSHGYHEIDDPENMKFKAKDMLAKKYKKVV